MPLGTAGPIKKAEKLFGHDEPFIVLNGDIFADLSYRELLETHIKMQCISNNCPLQSGRPMQVRRGGNGRRQPYKKIH